MSNDLDRQFANLLRDLIDRSAPETRAQRHLLHLDVHDTYVFALRHPQQLRVAEDAQP